MFNRRLYILIFTFAITLGLLIWNWHSSPGVLLNAASGQVSMSRWEMDLGGQWKLYPSLRQAWSIETDHKDEGIYSPLTTGEAVYLPSNKEFHVATKTFKIPAEWNARSIILQINGIYGDCSVYLNGMESSNRIGGVAGEGESARLQIPVSSLNHGQENLLIIELDASPARKNTLLGSGYPHQGRIMGTISLQAVMETSIENPQLRVSWEEDVAGVEVSFQLSHHEFSEYGPWTVQGVISDGSAEVAQASVQVHGDENPVQPVKLTFQIPNGHVWSPEDPFLYQVYLSVNNANGDRDDVAFPIGLKRLGYQEGVGFSLNDQELVIKGLAISPERESELRNRGEITSWLREIKEQGYNLLYFIGNLPDEYWLQAADRLGIGIWAELPGTGMVPVQRLPEPKVWEDLFRVGSLHPSIWAYTSGIGLEYNYQSAVKDYLEKTQALAGAIPTFNLNLPEQSSIKGTWGEIHQYEEGQEVLAILWPEEKWVSIMWAGLLVLIAWFNLVSVNWRYKELQNKKPKRALRKAWFWQGLALATREMTLAGLITALIFNTDVPWSQWVPNQWPLWEGLKLQSPWLVWLIFGSFFTLLRLLQVGVVAPRMPGAPDAMGLAAWLERRFFWNWIVGILWALQGWWVPRSVPILAYLAFNVLFLPLKIRDVHRAGGRYGAFLWVPGMICLIILIMALLYRDDIVYLSNMIMGSQWLKEILLLKKLNLP